MSKLPQIAKKKKCYSQIDCHRSHVTVHSAEETYSVFNCFLKVDMSEMSRRYCGSAELGPCDAERSVVCHGRSCEWHTQQVVLSGAQASRWGI